MRGRKKIASEQKTMSQHRSTALGALILDLGFWGIGRTQTIGLGWHREPASHR